MNVGVPFPTGNANTVPENDNKPLPPVAIESTNEWQIYDILLHGQERYLQPLNFSDHVARLTHMVDWQSLVGSKLSITEMNSSEDEEQEATDAASVHVWDNVGKEFSALSEINVILDVIKVTTQKRYMLFDTVSRDPSEENRPNNKQLRTRHFYFVEKQRQMSSGQLVPGYCSFLRELTELRKGWRLKKARNIILGDLGFRSCNAFLVKQQAATPSTSSGVTLLPSLGGSQSSTLEIMLPADLKKQLILKCFIIPDVADDELISKLIQSVDPSLYQCSNKRATSWQEMLEKAQKTLLCRELFSIVRKTGRKAPAKML
ncbi:Med17 domain containing protein [Trichuris trichiura]|uniref:Med17 domain containing protein n=1 Tax=Trichuris trichiura TaxID=36087 RepID=A0A077Z727_TRITR|nr:Med17 domain containing protein [Trichuris trichiura]